MIFSPEYDFAESLDKQDSLYSFRSEFLIPENSSGEQETYLCGHSLGLQPVRTKDYIGEVLSSWQHRGVRGHFQGDYPWVPYHELLQEKTAMLVGALPTEVIAMNTLTANLHMMMVSFFRPDKDRYRILIEEQAFPSDYYAAETQLRYHGLNPDDALIVVRPDQGCSISVDAWKSAIDRYHSSAALLLLPGVQYLTGQSFPVAEIADFAARRGIVVGLDLAHAVGNIPLQLHDWSVDFACWCHYKYLNSGPGAVGGCFVHEKHCKNKKLPRFAGWWGQRKDIRFNMRPGFDPVMTAEGWQLSNPPIVSLAAIRASLDIFAEAGGMEPLRKKSLLMTCYLEYLAKDLPGFHCLTPSDPEQRGAQLSFQTDPDHCDARTLVSRAESRGIICDFREPDIIRLAPVPLYNHFTDVWRCVQQFREILTEDTQASVSSGRPG
ncbi:MAG: kynureninase [Deltaproteobacteria bacterium]|nr:kynureninase [Deltaproteobacteria bacterium]